MVTRERTSGSPLGKGHHRVVPGRAGSDLHVHLGDLHGEEATHVADLHGDPLEGLVEPQAGLDADHEEIHGIRERLLDLPLSPGDLPAQQEIRDHPAGSSPDDPHDHGKGSREIDGGSAQEAVEEK
jgi:hypothetical protein